MRIFILSLMFLVTSCSSITPQNVSNDAVTDRTVASNQANSCRFVVYNGDMLRFQIFVGENKYNGNTPYRNLVAMLTKMKDIEASGACESKYSLAKNDCYISDNTLIMRSDTTNPSVGLYDLMLRDPNRNYGDGFNRIKIAHTNSREEILIMGKMVQDFGLCTFKEY